MKKILIKKNIIQLLLILILMTILSGCGIKQTVHSVTIEAGENLNLKVTDFFDIDKDKIEKVCFDTSKVNVNQAGIYEVTASYKNEKFSIMVTIKDTTAPKVEMKQRYMFTNNIENCKPMQFVENIYDVSKYTVTFTRFEKIEGLSEINDEAIERFVKGIPNSEEQQVLAELGTKDIPTEEGIYYAVLAVEDTSGNIWLEGVCLILDTTEAFIDNVKNQVIEVEPEDIDKKPEVRIEDYAIIDNVDGKILAQDIIWEIEPKDEQNHEYVVYISYTDRAGNKSSVDFKIILQEKLKEVIIESEEEIFIQDVEDVFDDTTTFVEDIPSPYNPLETILKKAGYSLDYINQISCGQLITVESHGSTADISFYQKNEESIWVNADLDTKGFVGSAGVSSTSCEGSNETPYGLYQVGDGFYIDNVPQTGLNLFQVTENTYWVDDSKSIYYNQRVEGMENKDWNSAEHMIDYYPAYKYGFVIEFNTTNIIPEKGSAIFFHCSEKPTAGCVGISESMLLAYLQILSAEKLPFILIM